MVGGVVPGGVRGARPGVVPRVCPAGALFGLAGSGGGWRWPVDRGVTDAPMDVKRWWLG